MPLCPGCGNYSGEVGDTCPMCGATIGTIDYRNTWQAIEELVKFIYLES